MKGWSVTVSLTLAAFGCGGAPAPVAAPAAKPCPVQPIRLEVTATPGLNSLSAGEGRPVQLRVYQLKSDVKLRTASFEDVWQNEATALADDVVSSDQQTIFPGDKKSLSVTPKPEASHLALVALFREPQGKDWFLTFELEPPKTEPPCSDKAAPIPIWLDRMQIQDGAGRATDDDAAGTSGDAGGGS